MKLLFQLKKMVTFLSLVIKQFLKQKSLNFYYSSLFFTLGVPFPKNFQQVCKKILSRLFRVFVHVYIHHFDSICSMGAEAHINTCYKHYYYFISEFNLIDHSELEPLVRKQRDFRCVRVRTGSRRNRIRWIFLYWEGCQYHSHNCQSSRKYQSPCHITSLCSTLGQDELYL